MKVIRTRNTFRIYRTRFKTPDVKSTTSKLVIEELGYYRLSHKHEWNTEKCSVLRPVSNKAEDRVGYGTQTRHIFRERYNEFIFQRAKFTISERYFATKRTKFRM